MPVFTPKKKVGGPYNDFFFDTFDKGMNLPRHPSVRVGTFIVIFALLLCVAFIITGV